MSRRCKDLIERFLLAAAALCAVSPRLGRIYVQRPYVAIPERAMATAWFAHECSSHRGVRLAPVLLEPQLPVVAIAPSPVEAAGRV